MENWVLLRKGADFQHISEKFHISPRVASLIRNRDVIGDDAIEKYLNGTIADLYDGMLMKDMDRAVARISQGLEQGETIAVYGDYDVDGITATCLLTDCLRALGGRVIPYIPDRMEEGYGLNREAVAALREQGVTLIVTVDCGITAVEEARWAGERWWTPTERTVPTRLSSWRGWVWRLR